MGFALSDMQLKSTDFAAHGPIPSQFTGEGENVSPQLSWDKAPAGTKSFAIICHDPDAPLISANGTYGFVHWVLYNLPGSTTELETASQLGTQGKNDFGNLGYGGPMPPPGHGQHHYYFWVLALDIETDLPEGQSMWQALEQLEPHIIGANRLIGTYQRA